MGTTVKERQDVLAVDQENALTPDESIQSCVCGLLASFRPQSARLERRSSQRYPFPYLLHLTPIGADGDVAEQETLVVVGKHLSEQGLGFYHTRPLPHRRMIVSFETGSGSWLSFLIDLTWCRFTKQGWYESGGRFLQSVPSPVDSAPT